MHEFIAKMERRKTGIAVGMKQNVGRRRMNNTYLETQPEGRRPALRVALSWLIFISGALVFWQQCGSNGNVHICVFYK